MVIVRVLCIFLIWTTRCVYQPPLLKLIWDVPNQRTLPAQLVSAKFQILWITITSAKAEAKPFYDFSREISACKDLK